MRSPIDVVESNRTLSRRNPNILILVRPALFRHDKFDMDYTESDRGLHEISAFDFSFVSRLPQALLTDHRAVQHIV